MTFGEKIQYLRKQNGLSQEALAEIMSVTRQTISKWELDQSFSDLEYICRLSDYFEVTTDYLIKDSDKIPSGLKVQAVQEINNPPPEKAPAVNPMDRKCVTLRQIAVVAFGFAVIADFICAGNYLSHGNTVLGVVWMLIACCPLAFFVLNLIKMIKQ